MIYCTSGLNVFRRGAGRFAGALAAALFFSVLGPAHAAEDEPAEQRTHPALAGVDWSTAREIIVALDDHSYEPDEIELKLGQPYKIVLENVGRFAHDMVGDDNVGGTLFEESVVALRMVNSKVGRVTAGSVRSVYVRAKNQIELWLVPLKAGEYTFYCSIKGHREDGMEGIVRIVP